MTDEKPGHCSWQDAGWQEIQGQAHHSSLGAFASVAPKGDYAAIRESWRAIAKGITDPQAIIRYVWGEFNEEMFDYMGQDCSTNFELWKHLRPDEYSQDAVES